MKTFNLKELGASKEDSVILLEMFLEQSRFEGETIVKILHGYGSHGKGGVLFSAVREKLELLKRQKKIKDYYGGVKWNLLDAETVSALLKDKQCIDEDLNRSNPGITIVIL
jgi:hypothetical protein